ncbi:family 20 glycosylhydrolase [Actinocorallia aurantiaca]|uniref:beta-N-acetylhexosaminidase n=1 Tax=Actinocorallia aurantiaca TaxID=46204 RepID=A0ABN3TUW5_9ACTN
MFRSRWTAAAVAAVASVASLFVTGPARAAAPVNLALAGTASASSIELDSATFAASYANDGSTATRWSSKYADDNWVQVALAANSHVDHVTLVWPNACARDFALQTSGDGVTWTTVSRLQRTTCPRTDTIAVGATTRYVRMQGYQRWASYGYSISEFQIWDAPDAPVLGLLPKPVSVTTTGGSPYTLSSSSPIVALGADAQAPANYLAGVLRPSTGYALPVTTADGGTAPIVIRVGSGYGPPGKPEGYTLSAAPGRIEIAASSAGGALNGVQTLRQLFPQWAESRTVVAASWTVPAVTITDYPRFGYRGMMIDVARSFYPVADIKKFIDTAASYKINRLHLHLTDDQGWRIAIDDPADNPSGIDYSLLTSVSGATAASYNGTTMLGTELGATGYYTKADYAEIVRYAGVNGMTVVPEIDMPGHVNAALHAIPQLNSAGSKPALASGATTVPANGTSSVGYSSLDAANPVTYEFTRRVLTQIAAMTPGPYLHIGGDESLVTSSANYTTMINAFTAQVAGLGKTVVGWNEYSGTALPSNNSVIQYWNGSTAPVASAVTTRGAKVILSPAPYTYIPQRQDSRQPQGGTWACGGPCTLAGYYSLDPGTFISGIAESSVLGVETAQWGEWLRGVRQVEYFAYPRLIANAEAGWSPQSVRNFTDFTARLAVAGGRMTVRGVNFFPSADVPWRAVAVGNSRSVPVGGTGATWTVTVPGAAVSDLTAAIAWSDGTRETVTPTTTRTASIPNMWLNAAFTVTSARTFTQAGTYTGTLLVGRTGEVPTEAPIKITVP